MIKIISAPQESIKRSRKIEGDIHGRGQGYKNGRGIEEGFGHALYFSENLVLPPAPNYFLINF